MNQNPLELRKKASFTLFEAARCCRITLSEILMSHPSHIVSLQSGSAISFVAFKQTLDRPAPRPIKNESGGGVSLDV